VDLANAMVEYGLPVEVSILAPAGSNYRERIAPEIDLIEYRSGNTRNNPFLWLELAGHIRRFSPDIVHTHYAKATEIYRILNRFLRKPFVATKHNPRKGAVYEKIDNVIAVSKVVQESVKTGKAVVIYNGIAPVTVTRELSEESDRIKLLCVGRLDPIKGYDRLIALLSGIDLPWELTILGEGGQRDALETLVSRNGLSGRVHLPGFRTDIPQQMANCDIFISSSLSEGFGIAILEAMNYAPLVLSTRTGIAVEICPDWLLLDLDSPQSLETAMREYRERQARFREWVTHVLPDFYIENTARQHMALYRKIISETRTG
jgi:glycosyltransferase involved in cell wall biosynthesis